MDEFEITAVPLDLSAALGGPGTFRVQNRGPATVYRAEWPTMPTPGVDARRLAAPGRQRGERRGHARREQPSYMAVDQRRDSDHRAGGCRCLIRL